jgi:ATP-binding cassette subfamily C (CFTR/MRP) protein 1
MLDGQSQVVLEASRPGDLLHSFGSAIESRRQPFCTDSEGWGPFSSSRFDLTPCFLDVIVAVLAVWGTLSGLAALWLLLKKRIPQPVSKNWHFYTKLVSTYRTPPRTS